MKRSVQDILNKPYARILIRDEDGTYTAEILEFPGCFAEGDTPDEAIDDLDKAASSWIETAIEQNEEIPEPFASYGYSGKINLRLPKSIHKQAARFAQKDDVSLNQFFASAIATRVGAEEFCDRLIHKVQDQMARSASMIHMRILSSFQYSGIISSFQYSGITFLNPGPTTCFASEIPKQLPYINTQTVEKGSTVGVVHSTKVGDNG